MFYLLTKALWKKFIHSQKKPSLKRQYLKFNFLFLTATVIPLILVGMINYLIDPYDFYDTPNFLGLNESKPKKDFNDRLFKVADIIRIKPATVILGSSRTKQGINPEHSALIDAQPAYNLALNGPNLYEVRRYLEHAIANQKELHQVILGVDFFMFNENLKNQSSFSEDRLEKQYFVLSDLVNTLLSIDTLGTSKITIEASIRNKDGGAEYGSNGFMPHRKVNDGKTEGRFKHSIALFFNLHSNYIFSQEYFAEFQKIVELCQKNKIKFIAFIPPSHATDTEAVRVIDEWEAMENWKREMVKITPVWDFSGYNSITTEKIASKMKNYADNSHFTILVGDLVLERVLSKDVAAVPSDFGVLMTPENIEAHLNQIRSDRENWLKQHSDDAALVYQIKQNLERKLKQD